SGTSETTDPIEINLTPGEECYCIPEIMVGCILGDRISNITLSGETIELNNDSQCSSGQEGYEDYTNDNEINIPDLQQGETYTLSVSTGSITPSEEHVRAWIDYNGNGNFSDNEEIFYTGGEEGLDEDTGTTEMEFTVPEDVQP